MSHIEDEDILIGECDSINHGLATVRTTVRGAVIRSEEEQVKIETATKARRAIAAVGVRGKAMVVFSSHPMSWLPPGAMVDVPQYVGPGIWVITSEGGSSRADRLRYAKHSKRVVEGLLSGENPLIAPSTAPISAMMRGAK